MNINKLIRVHTILACSKGAVYAEEADVGRKFM